MSANFRVVNFLEPAISLQELNSGMTLNLFLQEFLQTYLHVDMRKGASFVESSAGVDLGAESTRARRYRTGPNKPACPRGSGQAN